MASADRWKVAYTWNRTSTTFDPDINPKALCEGFGLTSGLPWLRTSRCKPSTCCYSENTNSKLPRHTHDSFAAGGQVSTKLDFGFLTARRAYHPELAHVDAILNASGFRPCSHDHRNPPTAPTPVTVYQRQAKAPMRWGTDLPSVAPCAVAANGMTNATTVDAKGAVHSCLAFFCRLILNNQIKTGSAVCAQPSTGVRDNLDAALTRLTRRASTTLGSQAHAYLFDVKPRQNKNKTM